MDRWDGRRWSCQFIVAGTSMIALMLPVFLVGGGGAAADVSRRLGDLDGFRRAWEVKARETYLAALFRARQDASLDGVLRVAEAFADLGDAAVVQRCLDIARAVAAQARDARGEDRVRVFAERWAARRLEAEKQNGAGRVAR